MTPKIVQVGDLVYVKFADPTTQDDGWLDAKNVEDFKPFTPEIVGYVAGIKNNTLKIAFGKIALSKEYATLFLIPFGCILELRRLSELGEARRLPS